MVITILEARVDADKMPTLEGTFKQNIQKLDKGIAQTFLLHDLKDRELWHILTVWESKEALAEMRNLGKTPRGILMFRAADAEPVLSVMEVSEHAAA